MALSKQISNQKLGAYEVIQRLGVGGMAETFVAIRRGPGGFEQKVCLKQILPAFSEDAEFIRLFLSEAKIAATLRHSNIVQVIDFGVVDGAYFLALELVDGLDANALLKWFRSRRKTIDPAIVCYLAHELGSALLYAHGDSATSANRVFHRDISPSNVLLSTSGAVKITDFGIAKATGAADRTHTGVVRGKASYMAPEYALGGHYDARSDLFSLGVTLYEALAGRRPFSGATDIETVHRMQAGAFEPLITFCPDAPEALIKAIETLIQPLPESRMANAAELLDALVHAPPPPNARRTLGALVAETMQTREGPSPAQKEATSATELIASLCEEPVAQEVPEPADVEVRAASPHDPTQTKVPISERATRPVYSALVDPELVDESILAPVDSSAPSKQKRRISAAVFTVLVAAAVFVIGLQTFNSKSAQTRNHKTPVAENRSKSTSKPKAVSVSHLVPANVNVNVDPPTPSAVEIPALPVASEKQTPVTALPVDVSQPGEHPGIQGTVRVSVLPYGRVWVDGVLRGPAPKTLELSPGNHVIAGGIEGPEVKQTIRVKAEKTRRVLLQIPPPRH